MKIRQLLKEAGGITAAFAFGRFNPAHQGHVAVWQTVEKSGVKWYIGTNPSTIGPNDPLTFEQKKAWMEEIYPQIQGHIVPEQSVVTLAVKIFNDLGKNEDSTIGYVTDDTDWAWSGKLLNQYNGVEGKHGYYKFAQIVHIPSPRVSSATALRDAARAGDRAAFYHASGTDPKLKVAGKTYFDTVAEACAKYPLPVKKAKKTESINEMDSQGYTGSREHKSSSKYGSRDDYELGHGKEYTGKSVKSDEVGKTALDILNREMEKSHKKDVDEGTGNIGQQIKALYQKIHAQGDDAVEFMYYDSPIFAQYWDEYEGDLDSIIAEVDPSELQVIYSELESAAEDQGLLEVSTELRNRYVARASDDYGHANFAARASKSHPGLEKYSQEQERRAENRKAGLNRALSDKRLGRVEEGEMEYGPEWDEMVKRVGQKAQEGERKTVWDPEKRVYKTVPVNPPKKEQGVAEGSEADAYGNTGEKHECGSCDGTGIVSYDELAKAAEYDDVCPECGGKGWVRDKESLKKKGVAEVSNKVHLRTPKHGMADHAGRDTGVSKVKFGQTPEKDRCPKCHDLYRNHYKQGIEEASLATMRDYFAGQEDAEDPLKITQMRQHFGKEGDVAAKKRKEFRSEWEYQQWLKKNKMVNMNKSPVKEELKQNWVQKVMERKK